MVEGVNGANSDHGRQLPDLGLGLLALAGLLIGVIGFLMITARWTSPGRIWLDAQRAGEASCNGALILHECAPPTLKLHVVPGPGSFLLTWRKGDVIVSAAQAPRPAYDDRQLFVELAAQIRQEWQARGLRQHPSDRAMDQVVLHCDPRLPYREMVAIIDAILETKREFPGSAGKVYPALNVELVVDEP